MTPEQEQMLTRIVATATPAFSVRADELLSGKLSWTELEIDQFIDGYLNDPYLTRNQ